LKNTGEFIPKLFAVTKIIDTFAVPKINMGEKNLFIIAGCNGAGKTTASYTILPEMLGCREFVNADEIARGLSPFQPEKVSIKAGKIMLHRIWDLLKDNETFAFETTLSTKTYRNIIKIAHEQGYTVTVLFFWLQSIDLAKERVRKRVEAGGHGIEEHVIERRYRSGIKNLFDIYIPIVNKVMVFDNSEAKHELIAKKNIDGEFLILNNNKFNKLKFKSL
jgi:predicted ABC-type ATPase